MITVNVLIVENSHDSASIIERGIRWYNDLQSDYNISVIGEAATYEDAVAIVNNRSETIHLVFLDIKLNTTKTGLDFCKEYPDMAYITVSIDPTALKRQTNETTARSFFYIEKIAEAAFDADDVVESLKKFIGSKGNNLYNSVIKIGRNNIIASDIAFISKQPLQVVIDKGRNVIDICNTCIQTTDHSTDSLYITSNAIDLSTAHLGCLFRLYASNTSEKGRSISNFTDTFGLNPNIFIRIDRSLIININYLANVIGHDLYINLRDKRTAIYRSNAKYLSDEILLKIADRNSY